MDTNIVEILSCLDSVYSASDNNTRAQAYQKIEAFQQRLTSVDQIASILSACQADVHRNFGLHCLLCFLRNAWNRTRPEDKHRVKGLVFALVGNPDWARLHEALCKVVVELVKREWPQNWPSFVSEMLELSKQNVALVLTVFLRLSEDVFEFQQVPAQRRKDILAGLNENVDTIFGIVYNCLVSNVQSYVAMASQGHADANEASATLRLCKLALATLTAFMEWVKTDYLMQENALLARMLVQLLPLPDVCYDSSEAVLLFFEQKVKILEPKAYIELVSNTNILPALAECLAKLQKLETITSFEDNFSQRLCQIFCSIGHHIVAKVITDSDNIPPLFDNILELLVFLLNFPSKPIVFNTLKVLLAVVKNEHTLRQVEPSLPALLDGCRLAQMRYGLPSETGNACSAYSRTQFDSDEEYAMFFASLRSEACQTLQAITQAWPIAVANHLLEALSSHVATLPGPEAATEEAATLLQQRSPLVVQWDGLANHCEAVLARLPACLDSSSVEAAASERVRAAARAAMDTLLTAAPACQPPLRTCLLTALTAFLPFLAADSGLTMRAVQCVFSTLAAAPEPGGRSRTQREMRKHAVVCLLRLCKAWPAGLLPLLEEYCAEVARLCGQQAGQLSVFESTSLIESVVLLSNHLPEIANRRGTIEKITASTMEQWLASDLTGALSDPALFLRAIGLDRPADESAVTFQARRIQLHHCLTTIYNAVRSCASPSDGAESPVSQLATRAWPNLLRFMRCLQCLTTPDLRALIHSDYAHVFDLDESQKFQIMGISHLRKVSESHGKTSLQKMHTFLTEAHCTGLRAIVHIYKTVPSLADDWQLAEHLAPESDLQHLPELLLADVLRTLSSVAVRDTSSTPSAEVAGHLCRRLLDHTVARLNNRWSVIVENGGGATAGDPDDTAAAAADTDLSDEVVFEQCLRRVDRAFLDLLHCLLLCGGSGGGGSGGGGGGACNTGNGHSSAAPPAAEAAMPLVERDPQLAAGTLVCLYNVITWPDGSASLRAASWAAPLTRQLAARLASGLPDASRQLLVQVLRALRQHGASGEAAVASLVQLFLSLYDSFHSHQAFRACLADWTSQPASKLDDLDGRLGLRPGARQVGEKTRRDVVRRFLQNVIGKPVSEQFKLAPNYKNLPPLFSAAWKRKQTEDAAARENLDGIVALFGGDDT